jgi:hypothetical protein
MLLSPLTNGPFSGFATMALDCLLCETLQQFYDGIDESSSLGGSGSVFRKFLTTSSFQSYFGSNSDKATSWAGIFYDQIRCGILHMAEVKKTSRLSVKKTDPLIRWSDTNHTGLVIQRRKFHKQLTEEFEKYLKSLRTPVVVTNYPWKGFKDKMDFICRV